MYIQKFANRTEQYFWIDFKSKYFCNSVSMSLISSVSFILSNDNFLLISWHKSKENVCMFLKVILHVQEQQSIA